MKSEVRKGKSKVAEAANLAVIVHAMYTYKHVHVHVFKLLSLVYVNYFSGKPTNISVQFTKKMWNMTCMIA